MPPAAVPGISTVNRRVGACLEARLLENQSSPGHLPDVTHGYMPLTEAYTMHGWTVFVLCNISFPSCSMFYSPQADMEF